MLPSDTFLSHKNAFAPEMLRPDPAGGSYGAPSDPLAGNGGGPPREGGGKGRGGDGREGWEGEGRGGVGREGEGIYPLNENPGYSVAYRIRTRRFTDVSVLF